MCERLTAKKYCFIFFDHIKLYLSAIELAKGLENILSTTTTDETGKFRGKLDV